MMVEYTIVTTHKHQIGYSVANAPRHVFIPPSVKGGLTTTRSSKILTFTAGRSPFPSSYWGIADTLQIPILHFAFSHLFVHPYLQYLPLGCTRHHRPESISTGANHPHNLLWQQPLHSVFLVQKI